jgi:hypothetical protein
MTYSTTTELPTYPITWTDSTGTVIDFATGWTFTLKLGFPGRPAVLTKTTGITGAATAPNVTVAWVVDEFAELDPGTYVLELVARHTSSGKDRGPLVELFTLADPVT